MMPPHLTGTTPPHDGTLVGDTLVIDGWSLVYTEPDADLKVVDVATGAPLPFTWEMDANDVGEGDQPGAVQVRCALRVKVAELTAGQRCRLEYLDEVVEFVVG